MEEVLANMRIGKYVSSNVKWFLLKLHSVCGGVVLKRFDFLVQCIN